MPPRASNFKSAASCSFTNQMTLLTIQTAYSCMGLYFCLGFLSAICYFLVTRATIYISQTSFTS